MAATGCFGTVELAQVLTWGNHYRKYTDVLERSFAALDGAARSHGVELGATPGDPARDLRLLRGAAPGPRAASHLGGAYYAYQFLALNQRTLLALLEAQREGVPRDEACRGVMRDLAASSLELSRAFVGSLVTAPEEHCPEGFLLCNVGAAWDHEDLDVWALARSPAQLPAANARCGLLARESLRYAQRVQFYLSELLPGSAFAGTLAQYRALLDGQLKGCVAATQVLQLAPLAGDPTLFAEVEAERRARYFDSEPPTASHEGFLRGALAELQLLTEHHGRVGLIDPKAELYRLCRLLLTCGAVRHSLPQTSPWELCAGLRTLCPERALQYEAVGRAFDFGEALRYLFALFHAQETPIAPGEALDRAALRRAADHLGYGGGADPVAALLRDYQAHKTSLRAAARILAADLRTHVKSRSVFFDLLARGSDAAPFDRLGENLAELLVRHGQHHGRRAFWEDVVRICQDHPPALQRWARDVGLLRGPALRDTVRSYVRFMQDDVGSFVEFLLLLQGATPRQGVIAELLFDEALRRYAEDEGLLSRFTELFHDAPELVARFVEREAPETTARLVALYRQRWSQRRYRKAGVRLLSLLNLYHFSSNYSRRHSTPVLAHHPAAVAFLDDFEELSRLSAATLASAFGQNSLVARRQRLGDYYDLEFCRLSLMTLSGVDPARVGREFRRSSERYVAALFETCVDEVASAAGRPLPRDHEGFALFATGGNAREEPYDVDYDMFALLASDEPDRRRFYNRVLARLTHALTARGISPHSRLTDRFGAYVVTVDELATFLAEGPADRFIEQTELLGSRLVAGDPALDAILSERLVVPHVFDDRGYAAALLGEVRARHGAYRGDELEVKEAPGGLRDVQLFLSLLKQQTRVRGPDGPLLYARLRAARPELGAALDELQQAATFLRRVRDVYRLTVVSEDALQPSYFGVVALFLGYLSDGEDPGEALLRDLRASLSRVRDCLRRATERLGLTTAPP